MIDNIAELLYIMIVIYHNVQLPQRRAPAEICRGLTFVLILAKMQTEGGTSTAPEGRPGARAARSLHLIYNMQEVVM